MPTPQELHNEIAGKIVKSIVNPIVEAGGDAPDIMVLLETVAAGVMLVIVKEGGEEAACKAFSSGLRTRLRELRARAEKLNETKPAK
jgi:hypothetical protein